MDASADIPARTLQPGPMRRLLENPKTFTLIAPVVTLAGAATTIIAPMVLHPADFIRFTLAMVVFQYFGDFDLGLSRLIDRRFTKPNVQSSLVRDVSCGRFIIAAAAVLVLLALLLVVDPIYSLAGLGGVGFMLTNGPIALHRARSEIAEFTVTAFVNGNGMVLPRLAGLLLGGVEGCIVALLAWYSVVSTIFNWRFMRIVVRRPPPLMDVLGLFRVSAPLFAYANLWAVYLFASRWLSAAISTPTDAGLFAFGANLIFIGAGVVATAVQVYYPRHLSMQNHRRLLCEMMVLMVLAMTGIASVTVLFRFQLATVFPKFADAGLACTAVLISGIPIALIAWLLPLVIATTDRPVFESASVFGGSTLVLVGAMWPADRWDGIVGQSWACTLSAYVLLNFVLILSRRHDILKRSHVVLIQGATLVAMAACALLRVALFGGSL
jgi:O-antigen/teichoic acid export membrane protein